MATGDIIDVVNRTDRALLTDESRYLNRFKRVFTTRPNGLSWSNASRTWQAAQDYFKALPISGTKSNMETMSDSMAIPEDRFQQFIRESPWRHDAVQRQLNQDVPPDVHSPENILHVDAVPILKEGSHSVGVKRQWASNVGKIANCQQAVDLIITNPGETYNANQLTWPLGMELYVPEEWLTDPEYAPLMGRTPCSSSLDGASPSFRRWSSASSSCSWERSSFTGCSSGRSRTNR